MRKQQAQHLTIIILVIIHQLIGFIWYSSILFQEQWLNLIGKKAEELDPGNPYFYLLSVAASFVLCYAFLWLFRKLHVSSCLRGMRVAFICWAAFYFMTVSAQTVFSAAPS